MQRLNATNASSRSTGSAPSPSPASSNITIAQTGVDENQRPTEAVTINSVSITKFE